MNELLPPWRELLYMCLRALVLAFTSVVTYVFSGYVVGGDFNFLIKLTTARGGSVICF